MLLPTNTPPYTTPSLLHSFMETKLWLLHRQIIPVAPCKQCCLGSTAGGGLYERRRILVPLRVRVNFRPHGSKGEDTAVAEMEAEPATQYRDGWFDRLAIRHMSRSLQATTGVRNNKEGYESLIEAATVVARNYGISEQERLVIGSLTKAIPKFILAMIRLTLRPSKFTRESFALFTTVLFSWLVGPCEVKESEYHGSMEKNVVFIKKCRFLEGTNCVGMCTHMCKMPSQKFIGESLGMPVNMVPNFEDMSCEMIFGQNPPEAADDPALKQPCYKILCKAKQSQNMNCSAR